MPGANGLLAAVNKPNDPDKKCDAPCYCHDYLVFGALVAEIRNEGLFRWPGGFRRQMPKSIGLNPASVLIAPVVTSAIIERDVAQAEEKG